MLKNLLRSLEDKIQEMFLNLKQNKQIVTQNKLRNIRIFKDLLSSCNILLL